MLAQDMQSCQLHALRTKTWFATPFTVIESLVSS
ncbi:hypothetical protein N182_36215 [Sinorhizobium sp. GL2]|nr:hypothetical protein N182_36215 [Sinorhizobium sp. GL2]